MRDDGRKRTFRQMERFYETKELANFGLVESLLNDPGQVVLSVFPIIIHPSEDRFENKEEHKKYMKGFDVFKKNIININDCPVFDDNQDQEIETCLYLQKFLKGETSKEAAKRLAANNFILESSKLLLWFLYDFHREARKHLILAFTDKTHRIAAFSQFFQDKFFLDMVVGSKNDSAGFNETTRILVSKKEG
ncbi:MAG: hypothetical protein PHY40_01815 [Patescibacteria group bacterium]|nr:hypothetical protein [Patescibacteria group bacterium]